MFVLDVKFKGGDKMDPGGVIIGLGIWLISMLVFYMIIKAAVREGVIDAHEAINQSKRISE